MKVILHADMCLIQSSKFKPWHSSGGETLASHRGHPGPIPGDFKCDASWIKWHCSRFLFEFFGFFLLNIIPSPLHEVYDSPDQEAHYTLGTKLEASSLTGTWLVSKEK
jgi:hypothetical protein